MSPKPVTAEMGPSEWEWTAQREEAAQLVADDRLSNDAIAERVGVSAKQVERWKGHPTFASRVSEHVDLWRQQIRRRGLAIKERRIASIIADFDATETILTERGAQIADAVDVAKEPYAGGARTGFIVREWRGKDADTPVYSLDAALLRERRELRKQIAQELGEWDDERRLRLSLPTVKSAKDITNAIAAVLAAVGGGEITPTDGQKIAALLEAQRRNIETLEIEARLAAVEEALNNTTPTRGGRQA